VGEEQFPKNICGRPVTWADVLMIRQLIADHPQALRNEISRKACLAWSWLKPDGGLKVMSCKVLMLKLHRAGWIRLPDSQSASGNTSRSADFTSAGSPQEAIEAPASALQPIQLERVRTQQQSRLWNELMERYHYLGYKTLPGAQIRYLFRSSAGLLGAIGFSAAAWKVAPRDTWIGWIPALQKERLHLIINNSRFLILPWIKSKNLASHLLSLCAKQIADDWQQTYGYTPLLIETFVEKERFAGTCYKAANWTFVGITKGRGKLDPFKQHLLPVKDIYLLPLQKNFRQIMQQP
jgi:hypothetical protein